MANPEIPEMTDPIYENLKDAIVSTLPKRYDNLNLPYFPKDRLIQFLDEGYTTIKNEMSQKKHEPNPQWTRLEQYKRILDYRVYTNLMYLMRGGYHTTDLLTIENMFSHRRNWIIDHILSSDGPFDRIPSQATQDLRSPYAFITFLEIGENPTGLSGNTLVDNYGTTGTTTKARLIVISSFDPTVYAVINMIQPGSNLIQSITFLGPKYGATMIEKGSPVILNTYWLNAT